MALFHSVPRLACALLACLFLLALTTVVPESTVARSDSDHANSATLPSSATAPAPAQIVQVVTTPGLPDVILLHLKAADNTWLPPRYSLNAGQTWHDVANAPLDQSSVWLPVALAPRQNPDPQQNVRILLGDRNHTYRTGDYGQTWTTAFTDEYSIYQQLVISPANPKRLYSMFDFGWRYPIDLFYQDLARSDDAGVTWSVVSEIASTGGCAGPVPSPVLSARAYLRCGLPSWQQSDDGGHTWIDRPNFPSGDLALDAQDSAWLYGLASPYGNPIPASGRSENGGTTWIPWTNPPCDTGLMAHPTKTHVLFLRCASGLYRSNDAGDHWSQLSATQGLLLAPDYGVPGRILWVRSDGLWASTDDGDHWQLLYVPTEPWRAFVPLVQR